MKDQTMVSGKAQLKSASPTRKGNFAASFYKSDVVFVDKDMPIVEIAKLMRNRQVGDVIVTKVIGGKSKPVGMITDRDLVVNVLAEKKSADTMRAADLMTQPITVAYDTDGIYDLIKTMKKEGIGRLPIVDANGTLLGIVTAKKLLQLISQEFNDLINFSRKSSRKDLTIQH